MNGANTARGRRREKRRGAEKAHRKDAGRIENKAVTVQGRVYLTSTAAAYYTAFSLTLATFGDRATAVGDLYAEWRPKCIKLSMQPYAASALQTFSIGAVYPESLVTIPTTAEEACDFPAFSQGNGTYGNPFPRLTLGANFWNKRPTDWLYTQIAPADGFMETCGQVLIGSPDALASVNNQRVLMEWELEFRAMLDPSVSAERIRSRLEDEYKSEFPPLCETDTVLVQKMPAPGPASAPASGNSSPAVKSYAMRCRPA